MFDAYISEVEAYLSEEELTPVVCGACGGDFSKSNQPARLPGLSNTYSIVACRWCTRGGQTLAQRAAWERHRARLSAAAVRPGVRVSGVRRRSDVQSIAAPPTALGLMRRR